MTYLKIAATAYVIGVSVAALIVLLLYLAGINTGFLGGMATGIVTTTVSYTWAINKWL